ncbi:MAG: glycoside hydrolase family 3 N-terminal domain-containing protein [bacterium]
MTLDRKVGQLFMPGINGQRITDEISALIKENYLGGIILFGGKNVMGRAQSAKFTADLQRVAMENGGVPLLISIDQEGGVGSHVNLVTGGVDTVGNLALGASTDVNDTYLSYAIMADDLRAYGINMDLAPVLDVLLNKDNTMNHIRSFGAGPEAVSERAVAAVKGLQDNGVVACVKHFPGKGDTPVDSHHSAPVTDEDRETLERTILAPFRAAVGAGADSVMINHEIYTALDPGVVATVSEPIITGLLKDEMGFEGLVITDSITMGGVTETMSAVGAAYLSIKAGADMVLFAGDSPKSYVDSIALIKEKIAGGELSMERVDDAVRRILRVKKKYGLFDNPAPTPADEYRERAEKNLAESRRIARNTITVVKNNGVLPLDRDGAERILVVCPGSYFTVPLMEMVFPVGTSLASKMKKVAPGVKVVTYDLKSLERDTAKALEQSEEADTIVFGSIHAYWSPEIAEFAGKLIDTGKKFVGVGLSVPYDLEKFPEADAFIAAYNPRSVSLEAAVEVLFGRTEARGVLPVGVKIE